MMDRNMLITAGLAGAIAAGALGTFGPVYARSGLGRANSGMATFVNFEVTIAQAIAIAEKQMDGEAIGTGREYVDSKPVFYVEVLKYGQKRKVIIDLKSGEVVNDIMAGRYDI